MRENSEKAIVPEIHLPENISNLLLMQTCFEGVYAGGFKQQDLI